MLKKKAQVIMLPTEKAENSIVKSLNKLYYFKGYFTQDYLQSQNKQSFHLYIVCDDEIKEGDWCIRNNTVEQCNSKMHSFALWGADAKKIIATTDTQLYIICDGYCAKNECMCLLAKPSQGFITKFIEKYNKNNVILDVMVEFEKVKQVLETVSKKTPNGAKYNEIEWEFQEILKTDKNNEITISSVKNSWNRDEMFTNMQYYMEYCEKNEYCTPEYWFTNLKHF